MLGLGFRGGFWVLGLGFGFRVDSPSELSALCKWPGSQYITTVMMSTLHPTPKPKP